MFSCLRNYNNNNNSLKPPFSPPSFSLSLPPSLPPSSGYIFPGLLVWEGGQPAWSWEGRGHCGKQTCFSLLFAGGGCPSAPLVMGAGVCTWAESPSWASSQLGKHAGPAGVEPDSQSQAPSFIAQWRLKLGDVGQAGRAGGRHL